MIEGIQNFCGWLFSQQWDAVKGPWLEANKYTLGAVLGLPVAVAKWRAHTRARIEAAKEKKAADVIPSLRK
jgi:hypothetical protein